MVNIYSIYIYYVDKTHIFNLRYMKINSRKSITANQFKSALITGRRSFSKCATEADLVLVPYAVFFEAIIFMKCAKYADKKWMRLNRTACNVFCDRTIIINDNYRDKCALWFLGKCMYMFSHSVDRKKLLPFFVIPIKYAHLMFCRTEKRMVS